MITYMLLCLFLLLPPQAKTFKERQMEYERVNHAYREKYDAFSKLLKQKGICIDSLEIFLRMYKSEKVLELWGKQLDDRTFQWLKSYPVCASSGHAGPKRREGDGQVPEGFYQLMHFNPWSNFHLSVSINYPNESDRILGDRQHPGGNICIHGNCVTIGCIPITDHEIRELYMAAVEARNNGQKRIPVAIFPCRMEADNLARLREDYAGNAGYMDLWTDLKREYDHFSQTRRQSVVSVLDNGRYRVE